MYFECGFSFADGNSVLYVVVTVLGRATTSKPLLLAGEGVVVVVA